MFGIDVHTTHMFINISPATAFGSILRPLASPRRGAGSAMTKSIGFAPNATQWQNQLRQTADWGHVVQHKTPAVETGVCRHRHCAIM